MRPNSFQGSQRSYLMTETSFTEKIKPTIRAKSKINHVYGNTPSSLALTLNKSKVKVKWSPYIVKAYERGGVKVDFHAFFISALDAVNGQGHHRRLKSGLGLNDLSLKNEEVFLFCQESKNSSTFQPAALSLRRLSYVRSGPSTRTAKYVRKRERTGQLGLLK